MSSEIVTYLTFATTVLSLLIGLWQSIQFGHFKSTCCDGSCCTLENVFVMKDKTKKINVDVEEIELGTK